MTSLRNLIVCTGAAAMLVACGGSHTNSTVPSLYAGLWTGTWASAPAADGGTISWTITSDGSMTGTITRKGNLSGNFSGVVTNTGRVTAAAGFPTSGNFTISGQMTNTGGALSGSLLYKWLGTQYTGTFDAHSQSSTTAATAGT